MLVNGIPGNTINAEDRGLAYGDGVFRTLCVRGGHPVCWERQYAKLLHDCNAIRLPCPSPSLLTSELRQLCTTCADGVAKILVTRGVSARGYACHAQARTTRILSLNPSPSYPAEYAVEGVRLHVCQTRLGHQPGLAGIKHLNRLENVLAASEWQDTDIPEGVLCDIADNVISGTRSNLFMRRGDILYTPDLSRCGIAGVQRDRVLDWAKQHDVACRITDFRLADLELADEVFLVNSVFGLWPVHEVGAFRRTRHDMAWKIQGWLSDERH